MEVLINVNKQFGGYAFNTSPLTRKNIKDKYPNAHLVPTIFIESENNIDFGNYFGPLKTKIVAMLIGLSETDLKNIETQFIDLATKQKIAI